MTEKVFKSIGDQIELLKSRNLKFIDEDICKRNLYMYGYYEIVNGYKFFLLDENETKKRNEDWYKEDSYFEQIFARFKLDKDIRNSILEATLEIECSLRSALSYTIAEKHGYKESDYLIKTHYNKGKVTRDQYGNIKYFKIDQLFEKFTNILEDDVQPIKHYRDMHKNVPPWILLKGATFGNLVNFLKLQKANEKNKILSIISGIDEEEFKNNDALKSFYIDILFLCHKFRNRAAHTGRIYNYFTQDSQIKYFKPFYDKIGISKTAYQKNNSVKSDFSALYFALDELENKRAFIGLRVSLSYHLKEHLNAFPSDGKMILRGMGFPEGYKLEDIIIPEK